MQTFLSSFVFPLIVALISAIIIELFLRRKKEYKVSISALSIRSYQEKESGNVKISLSYKDERVGDRLSVLTFRVMNEGKKDILFDAAFEGKIRIECPSVRIIDMLIDEQSPDVGAGIVADNNDWLLSWKLLKRKEHIDIKMVCVLSDNRETYTSEGLLKKIKFVFRANNLNSFDVVASRASRIVRNTIIILTVLFGLLAAFAPLEVSPTYDAVIKGQRKESITLRYNIYNNTYYALSERGKVVAKCIKPQEIVTLSPSAKQSVTSVIILWGILLIYILALGLFYVFRNTPAVHKYLLFLLGRSK